jgi:predicted transcriptional regulator with HTH domain
MSFEEVLEEMELTLQKMEHLGLMEVVRYDDDGYPYYGITQYGRELSEEEWDALMWEDNYD